MALIAIVTTWRTALRLFGRGAATATALFLAVTPVFAANARYLTADAPMLCWVAVATWASSHILTGGGRRWYALAGVAVGLAAGTRYQGALASVVVFAGHVFRMDPHRQRHRQPMRALHTLSHIFMDSHIWLAGITSVATFLALNPYVLVLLDQFQHEFTQELRSAGVASGSGLFRAGQFAWFGWGPALTAAAAVGLLYAMARRTRADWFVVWGFVPGLAFLWSTQPVMVRYLMPAALLPALLAARLAAGWAASMNAGARFLGPLMGLVVFGAGAMQCLAFTESCARADPRMEAGKWIEANAPDGAVIAVLADPGAALRVPADQLPPADPWVFQLPPLDAKRFKLKGLRLAVADLDRATPDFVVLGEFQTPPLANREPLTPDESALMEALQDTRRFEPLGFPNEPRILGFSFGLLPAPHDVRYPDPGITVFRRVRSESR
jgi:4-amino-4-deoxy-L-arabinose transferase-like glycosyltransferase